MTRITNVASPRPLDVLVVEDNPSDALLAEEAMRSWGRLVQVRFAQDGLHALEMLRCPESVLPNLVLLDVNMPRMNGLELLTFLKSDPALRRVPVVMLTTSSRVEDVNHAYDLGANAFVSKPVLLDEFLTAMHALLTFWSFVSAVPTPDDEP